MEDLNKQIIKTFHHIVLLCTFLVLAGLVVFFAIKQNMMGVVLSTGGLCSMLLLRVLWFLVNILRNQNLMLYGLSHVNDEDAVHISVNERGLLKMMWSSLGTSKVGYYEITRG